MDPGVKHITFPRVIRYKRIHKIYALDKYISIFGNRVSPSPYNENFTLSTRSHICATILFKLIKMSYLKIGYLILLEINEYDNREVRNSLLTQSSY